MPEQKKKLVIFDIDRTLSDNQHRDHLIPSDPTKVENWSEWGKHCSMDTPITGLCNMARSLLVSSYIHVVFATARTRENFKETLDWLRQYVHPQIDGQALLMREMDDCRPSYEVKADMCQMLEQNFDIVTVFDDDQKNVIYLATLGYPVTLVAPIPGDGSQMPWNVEAGTQITREQL